MIFDEIGLEDRKRKLSTLIPEWEFSSGFHPELLEKRTHVSWVNYRGEKAQPLPKVSVKSLGHITDDSVNLGDLRFRDQNNFIAGNIHLNVNEWENLGAPDNVLNWIKNGVNIEDFFKHFKGNFRGESFNSNTPPKKHFPNAKICEAHKEFIVYTLSERICNGSLTLLGKVGECEPPHLILPLTVEPTKPRLCHDERFLNLWIKDSPFNLDTLRDVPRLLEKDDLMTSVDDKSGYDHIFLCEKSRKYFGVQFGGYFMVFNTIPFGFKASAFVYQTTGMVVTSFCRSLGVPCLQYIDDRWIGSGFKNKELSYCDSKDDEKALLAVKALYIVCEVLCRLGYFVNLQKSVFIPTTLLKFLGMLIDSNRLAFVIPEMKLERFALLRNQILSCKVVDLNTLQKFAGKCISFLLAIPSAKLFTKEVNRAISLAYKNSGFVNISSDLRQEIEHWSFLDGWKQCFSWRSEKHLQISLATDASSFKWGALIFSDTSEMQVSDFWPQNDDRAIHLKEAHALVNTLRSVPDRVRNHRVDAYVDNLACVFAWENQKGKDPQLNNIMKELYNFTVDFNMDLKLIYIPSKSNPADSVSRNISAQDCMLSREKFCLVDSTFGPHTVDMMSLDSNAMQDSKGNPLKHFTPFPSPNSSGVNVFSQNLRNEGRLYVYPPFNLILPLLAYLKEQNVKHCTMIVPCMVNKPVWWPVFYRFLVDYFVLAKKGDNGVVLFPSKKGYVTSKFGLAFDLWAAKLTF